MAANAQSKGVAALGRRLARQIRNGTTPQLSSVLTLRGAHTSVYDKNPDEQVRLTVVPDDVIAPDSDKYWAPHPQTGVFGPTAEHHAGAGGDHSFSENGSGGGANSVLEQKVWFRPFEDVEKPRQH